MRRVLRAAPLFALLAASAMLLNVTQGRADLYSDNPYIVADVTTGRVLAHQDALRPWYPASLTKLMTTYVVLEAIESGRVEPNSPVIVTHKAAKEPPSKLGLRPGTVLTVDTAVKIIMVKSANDITMALAEAVGGSEGKFIAMMNDAAKRLGMTRSRFANPHGLPNSQQITTARDMAILSRALLTRYPQYSDYFDIPAVTVAGRTYKNYNTLVDRYRGATGMKTGFVCASGYNLVATAKRGRREVITVVLGASSGRDRAERAAALLDLGFSAPRRGKPGLGEVMSGARYTGATNLRPWICGNARARTEAERSRQRTFIALESGITLVRQAGTISPSHLERGGQSRRGGVRLALGGAIGIEGTTTAVPGPPPPAPRPSLPSDPTPEQDETPVAALEDTNEDASAADDDSAEEETVALASSDDTGVERMRPRPRPSFGSD